MLQKANCRLGPNHGSCFNVGPQRRKIFILDQGSACYSALIEMSVWKEEVQWLTDENKGDHSEIQVLEIKS